MKPHACTRHCRRRGQFGKKIRMFGRMRTFDGRVIAVWEDVVSSKWDGTLLITPVLSGGVVHRAGTVEMPASEFQHFMTEEA